MTVRQIEQKKAGFGLVNDMSIDKIAHLPFRQRAAAKNYRTRSRGQSGAVAE
jgi:hypothetical protein